MATKRTKAPLVKEPTTYAEFLEREKEAYKRNKEGVGAVPPMNYPFKAHDAIVYGNLTDCRIEEVLDEKTLHISYHDCGKTYGHPYDNQRRLPRIVAWVQIEPKGVSEDTHFSRDRMRQNNTTSSLDEMIHNAYRRGLIDSPEYQRDYVWTLKDKQNLIKTIFDRNDIGKFLTLSHKWPENRIEIIDGKQRLRAIMDYLEGRFEYEGKTYYQLSFKDKMAFSDMTVSVIQLDSEYVKKSDVLWLFLSVNQGGVPQTEGHLAKVQAMYDQALIDEGTK